MSTKRQPMMMKLAEFALCAISLACSGTPQSEGGTPEQNLTTASEEGAGTMRQALTLAIDEAFVWVPAGTPAPLPQWSYNSENGSNSVTIISTGRYRVDFGNLYSVQGNAQVSAYGDTNARCKVRSWGATSTSGGVSLNVDCYAPSGTPTNSSFVASFVGGHATATYAHLWTESIDRDHTAPAAYSRNSAGQTNFVDRTGTGQYSVVLNGLNTSNGNVQVTAYGSTPTHCNVYYWTRVADDTVAHVRCFDTSGALADSLFTLRYMTTQAGYPGRSDLAYAWANDFISASYQPHATYQFNSLSGQPAISARRTATGKYSLTFPGMPLAETTAMVTAYGGASVHCHPKGWAGSDTSATGPGITTTLEINCYAANGNPADSQFTAAFVHAQPTTHGFVSTTTNTTTNRCVTGTVSDQLDNLDSFAHTKVSYDAREETVLPPTGDNIPFPDNDFVNDHVQGIGRLYGPSAKNWMVMTISDESQGGMFFVELGEVDGRAGEAFQAGDRNNTSLNRNRAYYPLDSKHPGGLQVLGTSIVATVGSSRGANQPQVFFFNAFSPTSHTFTSQAHVQTVNLWTQIVYPTNVPRPPDGKTPAGVGLVRLASRDYLMAVAGESTSATRRVWLYLSDRPSIDANTKWFFHNFVEYTIQHGAENVNFVTQCDGEVRLLHTSNPRTTWSQVLDGNENGVTNDITSTPLARTADGKLTVQFTNFSYSRGVFQNDGYCDFRAAANPYVTPSGKLVLYCASRGATEAKNYRLAEIPGL